MIRLQKLNQTVEPIEHGEKGIFPQFRSMFLRCLGAMPADNGEQAVDMYNLGLKIRNHKDNFIDIEDAEFKLLRDKCKKFPQWGAFYQAQVLLLLKEAEDFKEAEKGKERAAK